MQAGRRLIQNVEHLSVRVRCDANFSRCAAA
jgi:hypothetical protein